MAVRPGARQRCGNLARNMSGLADPRDDDPSAALQQKRHGLSKTVVRAVREPGFQRIQGIGFDLDRIAGELKRTLRFFRIEVFRQGFCIGYTHAGSINELRKQKICQSQQKIRL